MIIADTGFWVAIFDDGDAYYEPAIQVTERIREPFVTTLPVMTEVCYLLQNRRGQKYALSFLRSHRREAFHVFEMNESHIGRSEDLMRQYSNSTDGFCRRLVGHPGRTLGGWPYCLYRPAGFRRVSLEKSLSIHKPAGALIRG